MRKLMGKLGGAIAGPLLRAATLFSLIFAAFFLALPETADAQIWVSSGFNSTSALTETAYCSTSALDPATQQPSPAAADYALFIAACTVTPSTGAVITSAQCPMNPSGVPPGSPAAGNPTGTCSITFQAQPGITYTVNSTHFLRFWLDGIPDPACPQGYPNVTGLCWSDPLGYYAYPISYVPLVYSTLPVYSTKGTSVTPQDEPCGAIGDCASNQIIPLEMPFPGGGGNLDVTQFWDLAKSSAVWTETHSH